MNAIVAGGITLALVACAHAQQGEFVALQVELWRDIGIRADRILVEVTSGADTHRALSEDGIARFPDLPEGKYKVRVGVHPHCPAAEISNVVLDWDRPPRLKVLLPSCMIPEPDPDPHCFIILRVVDPTGQPLKGAVAVRRGRPNQGKSDRFGRVILLLGNGGETEVSISAVGHNPAATALPCRQSPWHFEKRVTLSPLANR